MPLNGSGAYSAPASTWNPAVTNTALNSTDWIALLADLTTALSTAMYKDGQATPTANIPMGGFRLTGLGAATLVSDAPRVSQVQNGSFTSLTAVSGTNTVVATATPTPAAYVVGQVFEGIAAVTNTSAATLNISSLGAGAIQIAGAALTGGELIANAPFMVIVSAITPVFQLISNGQVAPFLDTNALIKGSADGTKKIRFEADGITTATTRVITMPDEDVTLGTFTDTTAIVKGSADATKKVRIEADGLTTATTRVWTAPDKDLTVAGIVDFTGANGAGLTFISSSSASASATLAITGISGSYSKLLLLINRLIPATDNTNLLLRMSTNGGSSYDATASYAYACGNQLQGTGYSGFSSNSDTAINVQQAISNVLGVSIFMWIDLPASGSSRVVGSHNGARTGGNETTGFFGGRYSGAGTANAIQFLMNSGNITSGDFYLYGVKNA